MSVAMFLYSFAVGVTFGAFDAWNRRAFAAFVLVYMIGFSLYFTVAGTEQLVAAAPSAGEAVVQVVGTFIGFFPGQMLYTMLSESGRYQ
jgi:hypothetical protein